MLCLYKWRSRLWSLRIDHLSTCFYLGYAHRSRRGPQLSTLDRVPTSFDRYLGNSLAYSKARRTVPTVPKVPMAEGVPYRYLQYRSAGTYGPCTATFVGGTIIDTVCGGTPFAVGTSGGGISYGLLLNSSPIYFSQFMNLLSLIYCASLIC